MVAPGVSDEILDLTERVRLEDRLRDVLLRLGRTGDEAQALVQRLLEQQARERRRLVRDVHDDPLQVISAIRTRLGTLRNAAPADLQHELAHLEDLAGQAITRLRRAMLDRSVPGPDPILLVPTIQSKLNRMQRQDGIGCMFRNRLKDEPSGDACQVLLRVAEEALTNVRNHAGADLVEVRLEEGAVGIRLRIRDNGRGFDLGEGEKRSGHFGLRSMRERAALAGGWLDIDTAPGKGTTVDCWVPKRSPNGSA